LCYTGKSFCCLDFLFSDDFACSNQLMGKTKSKSRSARISSTFS